MSFFSIIIPTYNCSSTMDRCLQSIVKQDFDAYEVILVDGASEDDTVAVASKYQQVINLRIVSEPDRGTYDAMNKGVKLAKGQWLYFLGSDDELYADTILSKIYKTIQKHPDSKFIYGDVLTSTNVLERYCNYTYLQLMDRCICHQSIFYHKSLFQQSEYDLRYKLCADWDFNLKIFDNNVSPVYVNRIIARFDLGGASGNWMQHPEYLSHFANKRELASRYKNAAWWYGYYVPLMLFKRTKSKLRWIFQ